MKTDNNKIFSKVSILRVAVGIYNPKNDGKKRVYLHRSDEVHNYFKEVGTSNPKHLSRYKRFALESNR